MKNIKLHKEIMFQLPSIPNFLISTNTRYSVAISEFTEKELREIGREWTNLLVKKSQT